MVDVLIVGAGLSGLMCANELIKAGYKVKILEAQGRVGGRVLSVPFEGGSLELGAQWIAPTHHRMHALVKEAGFTLTRTYMKGSTIYDSIDELNQKQKQLSLRTKIEIFQFKRKIDKLAKTISKEAPWEGEAALNFDNQSVESFCNETLHSTASNRFVRRKLEEMLCNDLTEVSLLDLLWCIRTAGSVNDVLAGEKYWLKNGMQSIAQYLADKIINSIEFGAEVEAIHWSEKKVTAFSKDKSWIAKKIVVTLPTALCNRIRYRPSLPSRRDQLTQRLDQSSVIKCMLIYDRPFWREGGLSGISYLGDGPVQMTIDSSIDEKTGVITALVCGSEASYFREFSERERRDMIINTVVSLFGEEAKLPIHYIEKDWTDEPYSRGGYGAHFAPGILTQYKDALYQPIGPVHFAGSETSTEWRLYMEGALASGIRAANEIIEEAGK